MKPKNLIKTCLSIDCPERTGGECTAGDDMDNIDPDVLTFIFESNAIEGVRDTDSLLHSVHAWEYLIEQKKITREVILQTHKIMSIGSDLQKSEQGHFRTVPVWIGGHEARPFYVIPELIENWCKDVNQLITTGDKKDQDCNESIIKNHHIAYEGVHPFVDFNGRTGRMFMNWERIKMGLPILILWETEKFEKYYPWFR